MILGKRPIGTVAYLGGLPAVLEPFTWSWGQMLVHSHEALCDGHTYIHTDRATFSDHGPARNSLVDRFMGDWLLQLDTDHSFEPDIIVRMLDRMDTLKIDVLVGIYQFKKPPYAPVLFMRDGDEKCVSVVRNWWAAEGEAPDMIQVSSAGAGCLLVRKSVFDSIRAELKCQPFDRVDCLSEDHSFFWRCKELKIPVWCDTRVECNHLTLRPVTLDDYDRSGVDQSEPIPVAGYRG